MEDLVYIRRDLKPAEYDVARYGHDPSAAVPTNHFLIPPGYRLRGIMLKFSEFPDRAYDFAVIDPDGQEVTTFRTHAGWVFAGRLFDPRPALSTMHPHRLVLPDGCPDMEVVTIYHPVPLPPANPSLPL